MRDRGPEIAPSRNNRLKAVAIYNAWPEVHPLTRGLVHQGGGAEAMAWLSREGSIPNISRKLALK
jgi:hypothetical protein